MDKKSKLFFLVFFLALFGSVGLTYFMFVVAKDYDVVLEAECDPETEECFEYQCDPEWEECTGDPIEDTWYYKKIVKKAYNVPICDPETEECEEAACEEGEAECQVVYCDPENLGEEEMCADKEAYLEMMQAVEASDGNELGEEVEDGGMPDKDALDPAMDDVFEEGPEIVGEGSFPETQDSGDATGVVEEVPMEPPATESVIPEAAPEEASQPGGNVAGPELE